MLPTIQVAVLLLTLLIFVDAYLLLATNSEASFKQAILRIGSGILIACITYPLIGFDLMYGSTPGEAIKSLFSTVEDPNPLLAEYDAYTYASDLAFQTMFAVSSVQALTLSAAWKLSLPKLAVLQLFLTVALYPFFGSLTWGTGWLDQIGFSDFAGAALTAIIPATMALCLPTSEKATAPSQSAALIGITLLVAVEIVSHAYTYFQIGEVGNDFILTFTSLPLILLISYLLSYRLAKRLNHLWVICALFAATTTNLAHDDTSPVLEVASVHPYRSLDLLPQFFAAAATILLIAKFRSPLVQQSPFACAFLIGGTIGLLAEPLINPSLSILAQLTGIALAIVLAATPIRVLRRFLHNTPQ